MPPFHPSKLTPEFLFSAALIAESAKTRYKLLEVDCTAAATYEVTGSAASSSLDALCLDLLFVEDGNHPQR